VVLEQVTHAITAAIIGVVSSTTQQYPPPPPAPLTNPWSESHGRAEPIVNQMAQVQIADEEDEDPFPPR
jgi:hypothetical protein